MRRALGRFFDFFVFDVTFADETSDIAACTGFWLVVSVDANRDRFRVARLSPSLEEAGKRWPRLRLSANGQPDVL